ncbi:hypothetical protein HAX54_024868 [Datura stramonium]|uniref:Reverse transcriptase domain-containing protein n=1 Tax=Datura stramonium TaxID=4076 RepID=A0ABS8UYH5_DATST|nr:hypothetical protein [Datura stramonium]
MFLAIIKSKVEDKYFGYEGGDNILGIRIIGNSMWRLQANLKNLAGGGVNGQALSEMFMNKSAMMLLARPLDEEEIKVPSSTQVLVVRPTTMTTMIDSRESRACPGRLFIISLSCMSGNVVIKVDMDKTYDMLSWSFLENVLKKLGFSNSLD